MTFFTICSNNYLAQAIVLGNSLRTTNSQHNFKIFLCDSRCNEIDYQIINHEIIDILVVEPLIKELAQRYNIIELNTAVKPTVIQYLFEQGCEKIIYLDPDIYVYHSFAHLNDLLDKYNFVLTPHITTPIPFDNKSPGENVFLNYGIYNLGFFAIKKSLESKALLDWWKRWTYNLGYINPNNGIFVDQLPMALAPIFFKDSLILRDLGYNMAPWNLHERRLTVRDGNYLVNEKDVLIFYHFSNFKLNSNDLPIHYYDRYKLENRMDLKKIHQSYNSALEQANYGFYNIIPSFYTKIYEETEYLKKIEIWQQTHFIKKLFIKVKGILPNSLKSVLR